MLITRCNIPIYKEVCVSACKGGHLAITSLIVEETKRKTGHLWKESFFDKNTEAIKVMECKDKRVKEHNLGKYLKVIKDSGNLLSSDILNYFQSTTYFQVVFKTLFIFRQFY